MQRLFLVSLFFLSYSAVTAQTQPAPTPPSQPRPTPQATPQRPLPVRVPSRPGTRLPETGFSLNTVSESDRLAQRVVYLQQFVAPLYRKPSDKELRAIAPDPKFQVQYRDLLKLPNTGIFRLVPDVGCAPNAKVISAKEDCIKYSMPGAGNSFSFRTGNYRIRHLADITYDSKELQVTGIFMHGFLTRLGDVRLDTVSLISPGMKFVADFKPSTSVADVAEIDRSFRDGVHLKSYRYATSVPAEPDTTFAYRGVAYRGKVLRSVNGIRYNELDYDKREDVTVVFRIVEKAADGSITIVWRELAEHETPKIKLPNRDEADSDSGGN